MREMLRAMTVVYAAMEVLQNATLLKQSGLNQYIIDLIIASHIQNDGVH